MDEYGNKNKKKKFSFLASLGFGSKDKTPTMPATPAPMPDKKQNKFYVGNAEDAIRSRKKLLESIK